MEVFLNLAAGLALAVWLYLALARGRFWLLRERDDSNPALAADAPLVIAIVPARDEADCIADSITSLLVQRYPGTFSVVLVDDQSSDGTADRAQAAAHAVAAADRLTVIRGEPLPAGWTGKLWAQHQGVSHVEAQTGTPRYIFLTDADTVHAPDTLAWLVGQAEKQQCVLVSLMAKWRCESLAELLLIPAFVFFFALLYPFAWVNDRTRRTAGAAGGCMLVRLDALRKAGGLAPLRRAMIDDCTLARALKPIGPIWLGFTERVRSIRAYPTFTDIGHMVARCAYAQLKFSPFILIATVIMMALVFILPLVVALGTTGLSQILGFASWVLMSVVFLPTLRMYDRPGTHAPLLPAIALAYTIFTIASAIQHARGRGGMWKGRAQANLIDSQ
jgi:hopene-associated glycosyltransferase HpnB